MKYWRDKCLELNMELSMLKLKGDDDSKSEKVEGEIAKMEESIAKLVEINRDLEERSRAKE